jgi:hypothetical protein
MVIYLIPPWPDREAPVTLRHLLPSCFNRLFLWSQADRPLRWAPGAFTTMPVNLAHSAPFRGGFYMPEHHVAERDAHGITSFLTPTPVDTAPYLWSFRGTVRTAPTIRGAIVALDDERGSAVATEHWAAVVRWHWDDDSHRPDAEREFARYAQSMTEAKFVVCPRGVGPSSIRLFEAMQVGRCPVIVSDRWRPPPYVDWEKCSIRVSESEVATLPSLLRQREHEAEALGAEARKAWERYFSPERRLPTLIQMCSDIRDSIGGGLLPRLQVTAWAAVSSEARWRSRNFTTRNIRRFARRTVGVELPTRAHRLPPAGAPLAAADPIPRDGDLEGLP